MAAVNSACIFDPLGRALTIESHGDISQIEIEYRDQRNRPCWGRFELDADTAIAVAHDLLERASAEADCDEVTDALTALRALADRLERDQMRGAAILGDER